MVNGMGEQDETRRRTNRVSVEGRARMGIAGTKNLAEWHASDFTRLIAAANADAVARAESLIAKTVTELGGEDRLNARQASLIESQRTALLVLCLAQARLKRRGVVLRNNAMDPLLQIIATYSTLVRKNLEALGVSDNAPPNAPRDRKPSTMADRLTARWREQQEQESARENPNGNDA